MKYRRDYQETHDIDWFFRYKGKVYHAASNGGLLPDIVDSNVNRRLQESIELIESVFEVKMSDYLKDNYEDDEDLSTFRDYASKGFISLDREEEGNSVIARYHIVAFPANGAAFSRKDLLDLMPELKSTDIEIE